MAWGLTNTNGWTSAPLGAGPRQGLKSISKKGRAFHVIHADANAGDDSDFINLTAENNILAINTNIALEAVNGAFAGTVNLVVQEGETLLSNIIMATLSSGTPAILNLPPGLYVVTCTVDATTTGEIMVMGR